MGRVDPLSVRSWPAEMRGAMAAMTPAEPAHSVERPKEDERPKPMNMLGVMAHHPTLARAYFTFGGHALMSTTLTERQREMLALRTAALRSCGYEWAHHVPMARDAGLDDDEIAQIAFGPDGPCWTEVEAALLRAADELIGDGVINDATWAVLSSELDTRQLLDVIFTVGSYEVLAWLLRSAAVRLEDGFGRSPG